VSYSDQQELLMTAKEYFMENQYKSAEPLLNQLVLRNSKSPEIFHMLGTIYYDQGKFNKAIRSFKRALDINPTFTDASVGLSIILNDLGRYEEGQQIFTDAKKILDQQKTKEDPYVNEKLALKHDELGEMYFRFSRFKEAMEQYYKALNLSDDRVKYSFKLVDCLVKIDEGSKAIKILKDLIATNPGGFLSARLRLGQLYYNLNRITDAIEQWEIVLERQPNNPQALRCIKQAHSVEHTSFEL
jgi:tetratricopeptide (TPR) repeat protein